MVSLLCFAAVEAGLKDFADRQMPIVANVIHPMLVATNQADWESYQKIRAELSNRRLMIVCQRLFGQTDRATEYIRFLYQQQGLLQIFEDFCLADATNCAACRFPEMVSKLSG